jgi:hypothetical protein
MYYIKVSSTSTVWKRVKGARHWVVQPQTRFLIIWTVFSFVGFRVTIFAFGWLNALLMIYVTNAPHTFSNRRCRAYLVHRQNQYLHPRCLQYLCYFVMTSQWDHLLYRCWTSIFYAQISIQFRHTTQRTSRRTNAIWFSSVEWTSQWRNAHRVWLGQ